MTSITSPVKGFTGKTSFGPFEVEFADGKATVDDLPDGIRDYLLRTGYKVGNRQGETVATLDGNPVDTPVVDSRDLEGRQIVGTPLRDAAVDPESGDFLAPTNAGKADPHGGEVVSLEIHASQGVRPVKGGPVHADDPAAQDAAERAHAAAATDGTPVELTPGEKADAIAAGGSEPIEVPEGDLDTRVQWVSEAGDQDEAKNRAQAVYDHEKAAGDTDLESLGGRLTAAVYGTPPDPEPEVELKGEALDAALDERGLSKSGTADEKRARVVVHDDESKGQA